MRSTRANRLTFYRTCSGRRCSVGYFEEATRTSDREDRSQLFQLSCCDRRIVNAHLDNEIVLLGRGKTAFKSACLAPVPIWPERIGKVHSATKENYPSRRCPGGNTTLNLAQSSWETPCPRFLSTTSIEGRFDPKYQTYVAAKNRLRHSTSPRLSATD